ncbi:MAG: cation:proton antiporter subunit C [Acidiferrobacterales bacterium]|nr:cation:proton antiporter subunit C [Acidiferrobacterales bacterium]
MDSIFTDILAGALGRYNYWVVIVLMMAGFYVVIASTNLVKKIVGLNIFQTSVFIMYISIGKISGGTAPIVWANAELYSNPLPHVLILTAIVVGVATTALGLSLIMRIKHAYGSVEEDEILALSQAEDEDE